MRYDIEVVPAVWSLPPGHRVELVLLSTAPVASLGTSVAVPGPTPPVPTAKQAEHPAGGMYVIEHGPGEESFVNLPILPYQAFETASDPTKVGLAVDPGIDISPGQGRQTHRKKATHKKPKKRPTTASARRHAVRDPRQDGGYDRLHRCRRPQRNQVPRGTAFDLRSC